MFKTFVVGACDYLLIWMVALDELCEASLPVRVRPRLHNQEILFLFLDFTLPFVYAGYLWHDVYTPERGDFSFVPTR